MLPLSNCRICKKVFKTDDDQRELCPDCTSLQEAQYKVILTQIEKNYHLASTAEIIERLNFEQYRLNAYLNHRFVKSPNYAYLDGDFKEYCFICNDKIYNSTESACVPCLQKILSAIENRIPLRKDQKTNNPQDQIFKTDDSIVIQLKLIPEEYCFCAEDPVSL